METVNQTIIDRRVESEEVFDSLGLSGTYQNSDAVRICGAAKGALQVYYTRGAGEDVSTIYLQISYSHDGTTWFQETTATTPHDTVTHSADPGAYPYLAFVLPFDIPPFGYMRVSVKEINVIGTNGTVSMRASWMP